MASAKILHIFPSFDFGGQQSRFAALSSGLGDKFSHHVVSLNGGLSAQNLVPDNVTVSYQHLEFGKGTASTFSNISNFRKLFERINPDLLCTYNWGSIEAVLSNKLGSRIPHIHFEDGFGPEETPNSQLPRRVFARRALLSSAQICVPSVVLENTALNIWKTNPDRLHRIQNGIDCKSFQHNKTKKQSTITVGSVGALRPEKNYTRLITAFAKVNDSVKAILQITGEGTERKRLVEAIKNCKLENLVKLPGSTSTPANAYETFDIFALSSDTEQAPITLMEAMAAGLPVVATDVGDIKNMVSTDNRALITPLGNDEAFQEALSHLINDHDLRASLGAENWKKAEAEFDVAPMVEKYRTLFTNTLR